MGRKKLKAKQDIAPLMITHAGMADADVDWTSPDSGPVQAAEGLYLEHGRPGAAYKHSAEHAWQGVKNPVLHVHCEPKKLQVGHAETGPET
ncbi:hypothetical protein [Oryza sativa Japonica Group]|uniref:Uncharacterized protein n=1 Tax=Oryza sativa subsp. japonica TaxID=39947 RepID=Q5NAA5_ORYSJ|nr:hypothetical protein [Oryza sativa Japonica Group]